MNACTIAAWLHACPAEHAVLSKDPQIMWRCMLPCPRFSAPKLCTFAELAHVRTKPLCADALTWPRCLVDAHVFCETSVCDRPRPLTCSACVWRSTTRNYGVIAGFFDIASTRILSLDIPGTLKLSVAYQVKDASDATTFQRYKGHMTLFDHQEFRFYEQEPPGAVIRVGLRDASNQQLATGEYTVQGDEAGLPIAVHLFDNTGRSVAQIVFLLSCAPGRLSMDKTLHSGCLRGTQPTSELSPRILFACISHSSGVKFPVAGTYGIVQDCSNCL